MSKALALFISDLHLCHTCPPARDEPDWYEAMARPLDQVKEWQHEYDCPIFCAGDVFDRWDSRPELINWAIENLPEDLIAIPGQHDLPYHANEDIHKSAFWTLDRADVINSVALSGRYFEATWGKLQVYLFPYGIDVQPILAPKTDTIRIALIHSYVYWGKHHFPGVSKQNHLGNWQERLKGYDIAVFGDNHDAFLCSAFEGLQILNCGCLIRRASDERRYKPSVGVLDSDGKLWRRYLDTTQDRWHDVQEPNTQQVIENLSLQKFIDDLKTLDPSSLDFELAIRRYLADNEVAPGVKRVLIESMEKEKQK